MGGQDSPGGLLLAFLIKDLAFAAAHALIMPGPVSHGGGGI